MPIIVKRVDLLTLFALSPSFCLNDFTLFHLQLMKVLTWTLVQNPNHYFIKTLESQAIDVFFREATLYYDMKMIAIFIMAFWQFIMSYSLDNNVVLAC